MNHFGQRVIFLRACMTDEFLDIVQIDYCFTLGFEFAGRVVSGRSH